MSNREFPFRISRRDILKALAASASLPALANTSAQAAPGSCVLTTRASKVTPYIPKFFNPHQMQTLAELVEIILPTDDHSPGAKAAGVHEYIDEISSGGDEKQKRLWMEGLAALDQRAVREYGQEFLRCTAEQQVAMMTAISQNEEHPSTLEERFFKALKDATINGYYTSAIGIHQDLQYVGNTYLDNFPGCTHAEHSSKE
jgi:gluconate 2-dehydrogenase gamma chain